MADESYWTYKASVPAPSFADALRAGINIATEQDWYKLSPGMRREIYRQQVKFNSKKVLDFNFDSCRVRISERSKTMIFTKQARKNAKGVIFAPGKADISQEGYFDRADYQVFKLCENYCGHVRGGIAKTWRIVAKDLTLEQAKEILKKKGC